MLTPWPTQAVKKGQDAEQQEKGEAHTSCCLEHRVERVPKGWRGLIRPEWGLLFLFF